MKNPLLAGFAEIDLTPDGSVRLAGQFAERISESVESPVTATAMAIETGGEQVVLCSCDLVAISTELLGAVRARLDGAPGLDPAKVIICATHTHTSFVFQEPGLSRSLAVLQRYLPPGKRYVANTRPDPSVWTPQTAFEWLADRIAAAIRNAWRDRRPSRVVGGFGRAAVGMNRRVVYNDGSAAMWGDTNTPTFERLEGGNDSGIELMYVFDAADRLSAVVANVACPAQCVQHRNFISSDYWGVVRQHLRVQLGNGTAVVGLCGAAGDQCPVDLIRWVEPESPLHDPNIARPHPLRRRADPSMFDIAGKQKAGRRIAQAVMEELEGLPRGGHEALPLRHAVFTLNVPVRRVTPSEHAAACQALERFVADSGETVDFQDNARMHVHAGTVARYEYQQDHDLYPVEMHVIRLGDIAIMTNPFELFLDYGNQIKARSPAAQTFIVQLACGSEGYLPTAMAENGGHYSAYVSSGITGHAGGDLLVRTTLEHIRLLWE